MIRSCKDKDTRRLLDREYSRKFAAIDKAARIRLRQLDSARFLQDLSIPGLRLEKLVGGREGQYSIRVNDQYRTCFRWKGGDAYDVEIVDYH
jgi:proteic killer suppression protein